VAAYVDLGRVRTWYDEADAGEPLVLLHPGGAGVSSRAFASNIDALADRFQVFPLERRARGRTPDVEGPITFEAMAQDACGEPVRGACTTRRLQGLEELKAFLEGFWDERLDALRREAERKEERKRERSH